MKDKLKSMAVVFKALGDVNRLKIIKMLASRMNETLCVSDLATILEVTQPAASQHIKILKNIGLLDENRRGFRVYYTINEGALLAYKKDVDELFRKAYEQCPHDFSCEDCSIKQDCGQ